MRRATWLAALCGAGVFLLAGSPAQADEMLSGVGVPLVIDFTGFTGDGFAPSPSAGQLDSDSWIVIGLSDGDLTWGDTGDSGDYTGQSSGGVGSGGVYAFDVGSGNITLGVQPTADDFTEGSFVLRVQNTTGQTLQSVVVSYTLWINNNTGRANSFVVDYSLNGSDWTPIPEWDQVSPEASDANGWTAITLDATTILHLDLQDAEYFYLSWTSDDVSGGGSRDEFGIDDIMITGFTTDDLCGNGLIDAGEACDASVFNGTTECGCQADCTWVAEDTPCGSSGATDCSARDTCDGSGLCDPNDDPDGTPCTSDGLFCNGTEQCLNGDCTDHTGDPCTLPETCNEATDQCVDLCGNGNVDGTEECDDGNATASDGCTLCQVDDGWQCTGNNPSVCSLLSACGDGALNDGEECDDGDTDNGDGCSSTCAVEAGYTCLEDEPTTCFPDADGDGWADAVDNCAAAPNPAQADADGDGVGNLCDVCPLDPTKTTNPGNCPCGQADVDSDSDGTLDCDDECPDDGNKTTAGICGCGVADTDADSDGVCDTSDDICLAGDDAVDTDNDLVPDACDNCPDDFNPDQADTDGDGVGDACEDAPPPDDDDDGCGCRTTSGADSLPALLLFLGLLLWLRRRRRSV